MPYTLTIPPMVDPLIDHPHAVAYLRQRMFEGRSWPGSRTACRKFCHWLAAGPHALTGASPINVNLAQVTPEDAREYQEYSLALTPGGYSTTRTQVNDLRDWFRYMLRRGWIHSDPWDSVPRLKRKRLKATWRILNKRQVDAFLAAVLDYSPEPHQDLAVFGLMASLGLRVGGVLNLVVGDIDRVTHQLTILGKGGHEYELPLVGSIRDVLYLYLDLRLPAGPKERLWRLPGEKPLTYGRLLSRFHRLKEFAGLPTRSSPHSFRHYFITQQLLRGHSLELVAKFVGHSSPRELEPYFHLSNQLLRDQIYQAYGFMPLGKANDEEDQDDAAPGT